MKLDDRTEKWEVIRIRKTFALYLLGVNYITFRHAFCAYIELSMLIHILIIQVYGKSPSGFYFAENE